MQPNKVINILLIIKDDTGTHGCINKVEKLTQKMFLQ